MNKDRTFFTNIHIFVRLQEEGRIILYGYIGNYFCHPPINIDIQWTLSILTTLISNYFPGPLNFSTKSTLILSLNLEPLHLKTLSISKKNCGPVATIIFLFQTVHLACFAIQVNYRVSYENTVETLQLNTQGIQNVDFRRLNKLGIQNWILECEFHSNANSARKVQMKIFELFC